MFGRQKKPSLSDEFEARGDAFGTLLTLTTKLKKAQDIEDDHQRLLAVEALCGEACALQDRINKAPGMYSGMVVRDTKELVEQMKELLSELYGSGDEEDDATLSGSAGLATPGQKMPDGTVYLGVYRPKDRDGKSLAKTFNVFAAPEDLPETMTYVDAVKHIAKLKKWNGYDGANYATDKELYAAIKNGRYNGGWIIPTIDILYGKDVYDSATTPDNILAHKDKGAFKGTFKMAASRDGSDYPDWYWSSTQNLGASSLVYNVRFSDGNQFWNHKDNLRLSCRPVRLVPAK